MVRVTHLQLILPAPAQISQEILQPTRHIGVLKEHLIITGLNTTATHTTMPVQLSGLMCTIQLIMQMHFGMAAG